MEKMDAYYVRFYLDYNQETGEFRWKVPGNRNARVGEIATKPFSGGYLSIRMHNEQFLAHRVAWAWMMDEWPTAMVDHENRVKNDNRWLNLRSATQSQNIQNSNSRANMTGYRGVRKQGDRYAASITVDKKTIYLGAFATAEEASEAYMKARKALHTHAPEYEGPPIVGINNS